MDDEVDRYNQEIIEEIVEEMKSSPVLIEAGLSMFSAVRHLERIADHRHEYRRGCDLSD